MKKINIDITQSDYVFIDGATGQELTKEEFEQRYSRKAKFNLGANRRKVQTQEGKDKNLQ